MVLGSTELERTVLGDADFDLHPPGQTKRIHHHGGSPYRWAVPRLATCMGACSKEYTFD